MENLLVVSLLITVIGMTLLFIALAILYGMMYLMTAVLRDPAPAPTEAAEEPTGTEQEQPAVLRAAAIAVALARAQQETPGVPPVAETGGGDGSRWWLLHHIRRLTAQPAGS